METETNKLICSICRKMKSVDEFGIDRATKSGRKSFCKDCEKHRYTKECPVCGKTFQTSSNKTECCSRMCAGIKRQKRITIKCEICGKEVIILKSQYDRATHHYCSVECMGKGETLFCIGENGKNYRGGGVVCECDVCGKQILKSTAEFKKYKNHYCSKECQNKGRTIFNSGINSPKFDETLTPEERDRYRNIQGYNVWRKVVYERDNYTCQCCGKSKSGQLVAHHLDGFKENTELRTCVENGITLCEKCHNEFHGIYGRGENTRSQYISFICSKRNITAVETFHGNEVAQYKNICEVCGKDFFTTVRSQRTCSNECKRLLSGQSVRCQCDVCGKTLVVKKSVFESRTHHYCSKVCKNKGFSLFYSGDNNPNKTAINVPCDLCGKIFEITPARYVNAKHHYCSKECRNKGYSLFMRGENNPHTTAVTLSCDVCGKSITLPQNRLKAKHHYCSRTCQYKGQSIFKNSKL